nr:MAG: hypothetical protein [Bacteriophage sp.]
MHLIGRDAEPVRDRLRGALDLAGLHIPAIWIVEDLLDQAGADGSVIESMVAQTGGHLERGGRAGNLLLLCERVPDAVLRIGHHGRRIGAEAPALLDGLNVRRKRGHPVRGLVGRVGHLAERPVERHARSGHDTAAESAHRAGLSGPAEPAVVEGAVTDLIERRLDKLFEAFLCGLGCKPADPALRLFFGKRLRRGLDSFACHLLRGIFGTHEAGSLGAAHESGVLCAPQHASGAAEERADCVDGTGCTGGKPLPEIEVLVRNIAGIIHLGGPVARDRLVKLRRSGKRCGNCSERQACEESTDVIELRLGLRSFLSSSETHDVLADLAHRGSQIVQALSLLPASRRLSRSPPIVGLIGDPLPQGHEVLGHAGIRATAKVFPRVELVAASLCAGRGVLAPGDLGEGVFVQCHIVPPSYEDVLLRIDCSR